MKPELSRKAFRFVATGLPSSIAKLKLESIRNTTYISLKAHDHFHVGVVQIIHSAKPINQTKTSCSVVSSLGDKCTTRRQTSEQNFVHSPGETGTVPSSTTFLFQVRKNQVRVQKCHRRFDQVLRSNDRSIDPHTTLQSADKNANGKNFPARSWFWFWLAAKHDLEKKKPVPQVLLKSTNLLFENIVAFLALCRQ